MFSNASDVTNNILGVLVLISIFYTVAYIVKKCPEKELTSRGILIPVFSCSFIFLICIYLTVDILFF